MPKCDSNKVVLKSHFGMDSPVNLLHIFGKPFLKKSSEWMLLQLFSDYIQNQHKS